MTIQKKKGKPPKKRFNREKPLELTFFQENVLLLLCEDYTIDQIALRLDVPDVTIKGAISYILKNNKLKTIHGAIARFITEGY